MKEVTILFVNDEAGYYIEDVFNSLEEAKEEWGDSIEKVIHKAEINWKELRKELSFPTVSEDGMVAVIHKVSA
jgi:hypothetical protein